MLNEKNELKEFYNSCINQVRSEIIKKKNSYELN